MRDAVVVQEAPVRVEARSAVRLGYYRADQVGFLADLESACAGLVAGEGELLRAVYSHPHMAGDPVDVENVDLQRGGGLSAHGDGERAAAGTGVRGDPRPSVR